MEIFLNNTEILKLDVDPIDAPFSFSVADMKNPEKRKSSVSKTITIKGTASNMRVLQVFYNLSAAQLDQSNLPFNFDPRQRIEARVDDNGVTVFDGLLQIVKARIVNRNYEFEAILFSDMANIYADLNEIKIADLGWSEYNHDLDKDTIRDSWDSTVLVNGSAVSNFTSGIPDGFGYIYSWFDLGYEYPALTATKQRTNQMQIGVYFREVLQKIFEYLDISYDFTLNDEEFFKRMVLFNKLGEQLSLTADEIADRQHTADLAVALDSITMNYQSTGNGATNTSGSNSLFLFEKLFTSNQVFTNNTDFDGGVVINNQGTYNFSLTGDIDVQVFSNENQMSFEDSNTRECFIVIKRNGSNIGAQPFDLPQVSNSIGFTNIAVSVDVELLCEVGDYIEFELQCFVIYESTGGFNSSDVPSITIQQTLPLSFDMIALDEPLEDGDLVNVSRFVPDMKCSDFLKSLLRKFNLYQTDEDGVITFTPASDYYGGTAATDLEGWSDKLDYSETIEIEPPNRIEGKFYNAKWVDENDVYHEQYLSETGERYGNYMYEISNTWQQGIKDIEVGFSQSVPIQIDGTEQIMPAIFSEKDGIVSPYKGNAPRLFFYNGLVQVPQSSAGSIHPSNPNEWGFPDLGGDPLFIVDGLNWYYPQFHHTLNLSTDADFDLNFKTPTLRYYDGSLTVGVPNDNLFERYWRVFIEELTSADAKILTAYFKLTKQDIKNLDFSKLKEIDGVIYRLNIVDNFVSADNVTTKCELIKVLKGRSRRVIVIADGTPPFNSNNSTFMALIDQNSTDNPVAQNIFKNTMGVTLKRRVLGVYDIETSNDNFKNATILVNKFGRSMFDYNVEKINDNTFRISTYDTDGNLADGLLSAYIEVKNRVAQQRISEPVIS